MTMVGAKWDFRGEVDEDGTFSVLARITSLDGSGEEVVPGEGALLLPSDLSTITCRVFDLGEDETDGNGDEVTPAPTLTPAANVFEEIRTVGWDPAVDGSGYNFRHDVGPAYQADGGEWRLYEYKFTLTDGGVFWLKGIVYTRPAQTS